MKQVIQNILKWFEQLSTFVKVIGVVVPLLAGAVKLVNSHDNKVRAEYEKQKTEQQDQTELKTNVKTIIVQNHKLDSLVKIIQTSQGEIKGDMTNVTTVVKNLSTDFVTHVSKDNNVSKQDIIDIMQGLQLEMVQPKINKSMDKSIESSKFSIKIIPVKK